jgi:succinate-acetate transporter protein
MARAFEDTALRTPEQTVPLVGDPAPLGLAGFGITTLLLSLINAKILPGTLTVLVMSLALTFGGLAQLLAGMWAFKRGNTFAGTAFTAYGAFWFSFYLLVVVFLPLVPKAAGASDIDNFIGWYLLSWGIFTAYMFIASLAGARAVQAVFFLLAVTFVLLAIGKFATSDGITQVGGYVGLATAAAALYASFADVTNANFKRRVLPT